MELRHGYRLISKTTKAGETWWGFAGPDGGHALGAWFNEVVTDCGEPDLVAVKRGDVWNWFDLRTGRLLCDYNLIDSITDFKDGLSVVEDESRTSTDGGRYNWVRASDGALLSPGQWFLGIGEFDSNGIAKVWNGESKINWFDRNTGSLTINDGWVSECRESPDGYAYVRRAGLWNWVGPDRRVANPGAWFEYMSEFTDGYGYVSRTGGDQNILRESDRKIVSKVWFSKMWFRPDGGYMLVRPAGQDRYCLLSLATGKTGKRTWGDADSSNLAAVLKGDDGVVRAVSLVTGREFASGTWVSTPDNGGVCVVKTPEGVIKETGTR